ncbi:MAG: hypothetical protein IJT44_02795 [Clostridia bacterium]|nr:hypothetical protein [Clostridia bacterium]
MEILRFDPSQEGKAFKILNAVNGGPWHRRHADDQYRSNFADYKAARIPYSRNHDSAVCGIYGGPYSHDVSCIFPDFDADPYDPASYDFACTDESILVCLDAGTETFFRLGQTIEHQIKKHGTRPPKDFRKWAVVCEHIIRHYNAGWADGYRLNIRYWEIWNEPDLDSDDAPNKRTWGGTAEQFFDLYETAAKHLKGCFPDLKIGGPALAHDENWADAFLCRMRDTGAPLDFFSWHVYCTQPSVMTDKAVRIRSMLDKHGFAATESILNEWNYVRGWTDDFLYSVKAVHDVKGAAFMLACMCAAQGAPIDMLMYYDTRPSVFNGVFDFYTYEKLPGYYALYWYGLFYAMRREIRAENGIADVYSLCGADENDKLSALIVYYSDRDDAPDKTVRTDFGRESRYAVYLLDAEHRGAYMGTTDEPTFTLRRHSAALIKEI